MKFREKSVVIDAFRMGVDPRPDWFCDKVSTNEIVTYLEDNTSPPGHGRTYADIHTLEGVMRADYGDYIIQGTKGEIYPCKPNIFEATYESVEEGTST